MWAPEVQLAHRLIGHVYDFGGDLEEDHRLVAFMELMLEAAGADWEPAIGELRWLRASVKRGERLPGHDMLERESS